MDKINPLNQFDYYHVLEQTKGKVLVYFSSPACGSCRYLKTALEQYLQTYDDLAVFEVDAVHEAGLVQTFNVFHLPSMFLYLDGKYHCQVHSQAHPVQLKQAIHEAIQRPAQEEP